MKKRVLCYGDSNTWGFIAGTDAERYPEGIRWTSRMQEYLGDDYVVIEEGYNGRTTVLDDPIGDRVSGLSYLEPCLRSQAPLDLVVLMVGTNDTKCYFFQNEYTIANGVARLVSIIQSCPFGRDKKPPKVLMVSPILIKNPEKDGSFDHRSELVSQGFAKAYKEKADMLGCDFMDAAQYAEPDSRDGLHIRECDFPVLAKAIGDKVKEIIG